jgi:hypothetical protein
VLREPDEVKAIVTGVIAVFTEPEAVVVEGVSAEGVIMVEGAVVAAPEPAAFVATAETEYSVPGVNPVTEIVEPIAEAAGEVVPIAPETTGATVTVYESIAAPPLSVAAPRVIAAEVDVAATAETDAGAPGALAVTPKVKVAVPVAVAPPATVVVAVIV